MWRPKQRHMEALCKENELLQAKLETVGEAAKKIRRSLHHLHNVMLCCDCEADGTLARP